MATGYSPIIFLCVALASAGLIPSQPSITPAPVTHNINRRDAWPQSVQALIPKAVDTNFFSVDSSGNTQVKVSDHFSTVTVTQSKRGEAESSKTTTARVGIHTAGVANNQIEFSFQVVPDVLDKIKSAAASAGSKRSLQDEAGIYDSLVKRDMLPKFDPKLYAPAGRIANVINAEAGPALIHFDVGAATLPQVAAEGALPAAEASVVLLGFAGVAYVSLVASLAFGWANMIHALSSTPQLNLPHAVVIDPTQIPGWQTCNSDTPACAEDTCKGQVSICTSGPKTGCPCEDKPKVCNDDEEQDDCKDCSGKDGKCTIGDRNGCACVDITDNVWGEQIANYADVLIKQKDAWDAWEKLSGAGAAGTEACPADLNVQGLSGGYQMNTGTEDPQTLLYRIRQQLCQDTNTCHQIENLPTASADKVCKTYPNADSSEECEISVALGNGVEAWGYRAKSPKDNRQQCWDDVEDLILHCINKQGKTGWRNYPDGQMYQMGFRPLNGNGKKHDDFDNINSLSDMDGAYCYPSSSPPLGDIDNVRRQAVQVCKAFKDHGVKLNSDNNQLPSDAYKYTQIKGVAQGGKSMVFSLVWTVGACAAANSPSDLDFSSFSQDQCVQNYVDKAASKCSQGATHLDSCAKWSVNAY